MPAPIFVASYSTTYITNASPQTVSVTTQPGDILVVYGGSENETNTISTPSGNSISFTLRQSSINSGYGNAYLWTGTDLSGGTNWTLSCTQTGGSGHWGFTCVVFRGVSGIGASDKAHSASGNPSLSLTTTQANSALVLFDADWNAQDGTTRTWNTINGVTPDAGNGYELTYVYENSIWSAFGAYYPDCGIIGTKTLGMSAPANQKWSVVGIEIKGIIPAVSTIVDTFDNSLQNTSLWYTFNTGAVISQAGKQLSISPPSNAPEYDGYTSVITYDLTGSSAYIQNIQNLSTTAGAEAVFSLQLDANNFICILTAQGGYIFRIRTANSDSDTYLSPINLSQHKWWRIREQSGTIYWDTSPDCITWNNQRSASTTFAITSLNVIICAGTWQNVASPGTAIFDNLNINPNGLPAMAAWLVA